MLKIVIVGYGEMFTNLIAASLDADCKVVGVLRKDSIKYPHFIRNLKDIFNPSKEYNYIKSYNIPEINTKSVNSEDFRKKLRKLNPDIVLIGSWGEKFEKETFNIPKIATINAHPSLLPKYRGPNPYFWTIKNQEEKTGITLHLVDENLDTGAILAQEEIEILSNDTGESLKQRTVIKARGVTRELLCTLKEDIIIPLKQRKENATYFSHPEDLELDFSKPSSEIYALIRAIHAWGETYFYHNYTALSPNYKNIKIRENNTNYKKSGTITNIDIKNKEISVLCGDNKIIIMSKINLTNKCDRPFTRNYIKRDMKIGDIIY